MTDTKKIFLSLAMFITLLCATDASAQTLGVINQQIHDCRGRIDDARARVAGNVRDSMRRNPHYRYVVDYREDVDALRRQNEKYLTRAQQIIREKYRETIVPRTPFLFIQYSSDLPGLYKLYDANRVKIEHYEHHLRAIQGLESGVKNHFDSIMHAEVERYQRMIDELLNKKYELIR